MVGEDGEPVVGATVVFTTELSGGSLTANTYDACTATYKRTAITDGDGVARLWLLPGSETAERLYRLTILSPATSPYRSYANSQHAIKRTLGGLLPKIELARRHELSGIIVDADGEPLDGARIEAEGVLPTDVAPGVPPTSTSAETDATGAFTLYVDPGTFHLHVTPREGAPVPRFSLLDKEISASASGLELTAPAARIWRGKLLLPPTKGDGPRPATAGFTVNSYATVPKSTTQNGAALRASAITDESGSFAFVVPATP